MISFILTVKSYEDDYGFKKDVTEYAENELNSALSLICGITQECLLQKKCKIDSIDLTKKIGNDLVPLLYFQFENFTYRYLLIRKENLK